MLIKNALTEVRRKFISFFTEVGNDPYNLHFSTMMFYESLTEEDVERLLDLIESYRKKHEAEQSSAAED